MEDIITKAGVPNDNRPEMDNNVKSILFAGFITLNPTICFIEWSITTLKHATTRKYTSSFILLLIILPPIIK